MKEESHDGRMMQGKGNQGEESAERKKPLYLDGKEAFKRLPGEAKKLREQTIPRS
jgi:hypothetical protein